MIHILHCVSFVKFLKIKMSTKSTSKKRAYAGILQIFKPFETRPSSTDCKFAFIVERNIHISKSSQ